METDKQKVMCDGVPLKDYVDTRFGDFEKSYNITREDLKDRLKAMNEIRGAMEDQARANEGKLSKFLTKAEYDNSKERMDSDIRSLLDSQKRAEGKADVGSVNRAMLIAGSALLLGLLNLLARFFV